MLERMLSISLTSMFSDLYIYLTPNVFFRCLLLKQNFLKFLSEYSLTILTMSHLKERNSRCLERYKMKIKTNLLEEYINFVDNTKKQNRCLKISIF